MFKLKQIINKHNNAPEMENIYMEDTTTGETEYIYVLRDGMLVNTIESGYETLYISFGHLTEFEYVTRFVDCYRITPDMIFEVKCPTYPTVGQRFALAKTNEREGYSKIIPLNSESSSESHGYITDTSEYKTRGTVLVRFHCKQ